MPELRADDIHTYYGESHILQGVSLAAEKGAVSAVLGRNGVGKTTLIRSLIAFTPARRGRIELAGTDVTRWPSHRIVQLGIGLVPQGRRVFPSLSVREHLEIAGRAPGRGGWDIARVFALFPPLAERADNRARTLSGGEQQMLAVARALIGNPRILLMDEPTEGLSPFIVDALRALILQLKQNGMTILLVEQNLAFALAVADYTYVMDKGRIVYDGPPAALAAASEIKQTYLGV
jgi:branched-chain amino acid transport system ATP-binding protein